MWLTVVARFFDFFFVHNQKSYNIAMNNKIEHFACLSISLLSKVKNKQHYRSWNYTQIETFVRHEQEKVPSSRQFMTSFHTDEIFSPGNFQPYFAHHSLKKRVEWGNIYIGLLFISSCLCITTSISSSYSTCMSFIIFSPFKDEKCCEWCELQSIYEK